MTKSLKHQYAPVHPHQPLQQIFPEVYLLRGSIKAGPGARINRNMVVLKQGHELVIVNAVRMDEHELARLDALGKVTHVIRLGDFHGMDDQFYLDRYEAKLWSQQGHVTYPQLVPSYLIETESYPPVNDAEFFIFRRAHHPEAAILLKSHKLLITTDSIQYWSDWLYITPLARVASFFMGFHKGLLIGGPWLKRVTVKGDSLREDFAELLKLDFDSLIAAHGGLLKGGAKAQLGDVVRKTFGDELRNG